MRPTAGVGRSDAKAGGGARRAGGTAQGFSLGAARAATTSGPAATPVARAESLLALQAVAAPSAVVTAELAHADVMMDRLGSLQRAMLAADPAAGRAALAGLSAAMVAAPGPATDPALLEILDALALRAAIELARGGG